MHSCTPECSSSANWSPSRLIRGHSPPAANHPFCLWHSSCPPRKNIPPSRSSASSSSLTSAEAYSLASLRPWDCCRTWSRSVCLRGRADQRRHQSFWVRPTAWLLISRHRSLAKPLDQDFNKIYSSFVPKYPNANSLNTLRPGSTSVPVWIQTFPIVLSPTPNP